MLPGERAKPNSNRIPDGTWSSIPRGCCGGGVERRWKEPSQALHLTSQNDQLMSERSILRLKSALRLEWRCQNGKDEKQQPDHPASLRDSIASSTKIGFSVHTGAIPNQELAELTV